MNKNTKKIIFLFLLTLTSFFITGCNGAFQYGFFKSIGALVVALVPIIASIVAYSICSEGDGTNEKENNNDSPASYWCAFSILVSSILFLIPFFYSPTSGFWFICAVNSLVATIFISVFNPLKESISPKSKSKGFLPFLLSWAFAIVVLFVPFFYKAFLTKIIGWVVLGIILKICCGILENSIKKSEAELRKQKLNERLAKAREEFDNRKLEAKNKELEEEKQKNESKKTNLKKSSFELSEDVVDAIGEIFDIDFMPPEIFLPPENYSIQINESLFVQNCIHFKQILDNMDWLENANYSFEIEDNIPLNTLKDVQNLKKLWLNGSLRIVAKDSTKKIIAEKKNTVNSGSEVHNFKGNCIHIAYDVSGISESNADMFFYTDSKKGECMMALKIGKDLCFVEINLHIPFVFNICNFFATLENRYPNIKKADIYTSLLGLISFMMMECYKTLENTEGVNLSKTTNQEKINLEKKVYKSYDLRITDLIGEREYDIIGYENVNMTHCLIEGCESDSEYQTFKTCMENFDAVFNADPRKHYTEAHFEIADYEDRFSEQEKNTMIADLLEDKAALRKSWDSENLWLCASDENRGHKIIVRGLGAGGIGISYCIEESGTVFGLQYRCGQGIGQLILMATINMGSPNEMTRDAGLKISTQNRNLLTFPAFLKIAKYENMLTPFIVTMSLLFEMALS